MPSFELSCLFVHGWCRFSLLGAPGVGYDRVGMLPGRFKHGIQIGIVVGFEFVVSIKDFTLGLKPVIVVLSRRATLALP
ncbi:hypothetical protein LPU83_pLPU83c_0577 (plasmid) [Rhizobium favelukesii]|uniref:Uncharacterized protein n=1 Tax=Rhizobium favelukesii TaxID=348824 RepID=W6RJV3_9HYPH|nr:hypothetical protein LPU83_pLPU83c_0577 [Rhizobium favelukesii]